MSLADSTLKVWSGPALGAAGEIQRFGDPNKDYGFTVLQIWRFYTELHHKQMLSQDLAGSLTIQGSYASWTEVQNTDILFDILQTAITSELTSKISNIRSQLDILLPAIQNEALEKTVVEEYSSIPEVIVVVTENYRTEKLFTVFISSEVYDDSLMDSLLTKEIEILERFPKDTFSFRYVPSVSKDLHKNQVSNRAKILFGG